MMRTTFLLIFVFLNLTGNILIAQDKLVDIRFKGGEIELRKFLAQNLKYPVLSQENKSVGYSITGITITPEGKIFEISTINQIDESIEKDIYRVLQMTKNNWLKCDTISTNQRFYFQIAYIMENTPSIKISVKDKHNFIDLVVLTSIGSIDNNYLPESDESIATKFGEALKRNEYSETLNYINELIKRNPFNKELYQLRMSINRKLSKNDLMIKDLEKIQNFIPGVSLDELLNKN